MDSAVTLTPPVAPVILPSEAASTLLRRMATLVLMPTPWNAEEDLVRLEAALLAVPRRAPIPLAAPAYRAPRVALSTREATFAPRETLPVERCAGRVLAAPAVSCPPCVPIALCGEVIDAGVIERLKYYGVAECDVVR